jgi:hypothetical protein
VSPPDFTAALAGAVSELQGHGSYGWYWHCISDPFRSDDTAPYTKNTLLF